eukprot:5429178-Pleurochrysis_carterae.AAC.1
MAILFKMRVSTVASAISVTFAPQSDTMVTLVGPIWGSGTTVSGCPGHGFRDRSPPPRRAATLGNPNT